MFTRWIQVTSFIVNEFPKWNFVGFYRFYLEENKALDVTEVCLSSSDLSKSVAFWKDLLDMNLVSQTDDEAVFNYDSKTQTSLRFVSTKGAAVDHATASGRVAFSIPGKDLPPLESKIKAASLGHVKTPLVVLPTPGKADVQVVILEDPVSNQIANSFNS